MVFALGVAAFALCLLLSIAWHECGHMWAAQRTGMKVRRYFVGFGPTLWSTRRKGTEYGVKTVPLGGFCDIAGMTSYDEIAPEDEPRAMYKQKAWKRLVVLFAGPAQNFVLGFVLIMLMALVWGLPDITGKQNVYAAQTSCVPATANAGSAATEKPKCDGAGPAAAAGVTAGDQIIAINGQSVANADDFVAIVKSSTGPVTLTLTRDGAQREVTVTPEVTRVTSTDGASTTTQDVRRIGVSMGVQTPYTQYNALTVVPGAASFTGDMMVKTWQMMLTLPQKVQDLWIAVTGGERAADTPVSVYGASVLGGQAAERDNWQLFVFLLASINFFLGLFNLLPLLPLDGGHMAVVGYEKLRDWLRRLRGLGPGGAVDYMKLMPVTYAVIAVMGAYMLLTLSADIINPIRLQ